MATTDVSPATISKSGQEKQGFVVRRLGGADTEMFKKIRLEALRLEPAAFASTLADWQRLSDDEWRRRLETPVFVAFADGEPVGIMGLMRQGAGKMAHRATVVMVYVRESARGTGVAAALLDAIVACAASEGIRQLELAVSIENPAAKRFYERHGFAAFGTIPGGFLHQGREIDEVLMARRIAPAS